MEKLLLMVIFCAIVREIHVAYAVDKCRKKYIQEHHLKISSPSLIYRLLKRVSDIILSFVVCLSVLPLLYVILGFIIKITSKGPIIYKQQRKGLLGNYFTCYKFRSMYQNSGMKKVESRDDARITPIGHFIRKTHLDEFPQFFNVLKGDMSVVGPRPLPDREIQKFEGNIAGYERLLVRPGITGLTQVNSGRLLNEEKFLSYDVEYVSKPSLIKDVMLIFQTLKFNDIAY
mgnify:CR=1 FL=1